MIRAIRQNAGEIRHDFGVARLGVFGSHVRGDATADSDFDVLVEFEHPTFPRVADSLAPPHGEPLD